MPMTSSADMAARPEGGRSIETLDPQNWEDMRALAHTMVDDMMGWLETIGEGPVWQPMTDEVKRHFDSPAPRDPSEPGQVYEEFKQHILPWTMRTVHPKFWAWYMGSGTVMGALADFLAAMMNPNLGGGNHVANLVEAQVIAWMRQGLDFPVDASGLLTSGASMANLIALTVARNTSAGCDVRQEGLLAASGPLVSYASVEVHSCMKKAVQTLGLGNEGLRLIPVDNKYRIDLGSLASAVREDRAAGKIPFCIIGNAGTINTGAIDDLIALADFCRDEKLWFHVDGAIGAVGVLSPSIRKQLAGIERADSVALDLHKWMHIPFEAGCTIIRSEPDHKESFCVTPEYLQHDKEGRGLAAGKYWFSEYGLQLTRQFRALKVWMSVKEHGLDRFGRIMEQNVAQARYLSRLIEGCPDLEMMAPVGLDIVCFRYNPEGSALDLETLNDINRRILISLQEAGTAAPSYTTLGERYCLRAAISNHRSKFSDFNLLVDAVRKTGDELLKASSLRSPAEN